MDVTLGFEWREGPKIDSTLLYCILYFLLGTSKNQGP